MVNRSKLTLLRADYGHVGFDLIGIYHSVLLCAR
jgi:hypothetical protein